MEFFLKKEKVRIYSEMTKGQYMPFLADQVRKYIPKGSRVLELGMGPGSDYFHLKDEYDLVGSDYSPYFLEEVRKVDPGANLLKLDIRDINLDQNFRGIYSNKVLSHFPFEELSHIFQSICSILESGGLMVHSFWKGDRVEIFDGLPFYYYQPKDIDEFLCDKMELIDSVTYGEMDSEDSFVGVFKLRD